MIERRPTHIPRLARLCVRDYVNVTGNRWFVPRVPRLMSLKSDYSKIIDRLDQRMNAKQPHNGDVA